jgi:hypothetical protein
LLEVRSLDASHSVARAARTAGQADQAILLAAMTEHRISELRDALAQALMQGDIERARAIFDSMAEGERAVMSPELTDALVRIAGDRISELMDALTAAGADDGKVESIIDSMSEWERAAVITQAVLRVAFLEDQISSGLDEAGDRVGFVGPVGPFTFRTVDELSRVVELSARAAFHGRPGAEQLSAEDHEADNAKLADQLLAAEQLAAERALNEGLKPLELSTPSLRLRGHTHATVVPSDFKPLAHFDRRYQTLCGRGSGYPAAFQRVGVDHIDCPGCSNALILGGLKPRP